MTEQEFKMKLMEHHDEEINDHKSYEKLAEEAKELGMHSACGILMDIAHDEKTHSNALRYILEED